MIQTKVQTSLDINCDRDGGSYFDEDYMMSQVTRVEERLEIESTEQPIKTLRAEDLKSSAEMFIYLTTCPANLKPWFVFFRQLFQTQSPTQIVLALNRVMSKTTKNDFFKNVSEIIFHQLKHEFSLKYDHFKTFYIKTNGSSMGLSMEDKNFTVEGKKLI